MASIKKQVEDAFGQRIKEADTHNLFHIIRSEKPNGEPMPRLKGANLKAQQAFEALAHAELVKRGYKLADFSAMFLVCEHPESEE